MGSSRTVVMGTFSQGGSVNNKELQIWSATNQTTVVGSLNITSSLSKGSGTFKIPHPILSNTDLIHSFIEGPRADLIYRGKSQLGSGICTIQMDNEVGLTTGTWKALCRKPQVFLQNNQSFVSVRGNITDDGILTIISNEPCDDMIDWMVIAERQDNVIKNAEWTDENGNPILEPPRG